MMLTEIIEKLQDTLSAIWIEDDTLKVLLRDSINNEEFRQQLKSNKENLKNILQVNKIYNEREFHNTTIFMIDDNQHYPLSAAQSRLSFIEQYNPGTYAYHIPLLFKLQHDINLEILENAIRQVVKRHEVLRTIFVQSNGEYYQKILDKELNISHYCLTKENIKEQIRLDIHTSFNLEEDLPIRVCFYLQDDDNQYLLINIHHIAADGWSLDILFEEIHTIYIGQQLTPLTIQYKDFAKWQKRFIKSNKLNEQISYWKLQLSDYKSLALALDMARPSQMDYHGEDLNFRLSTELSDTLRDFAQRNNYSLYTILLTGFYVLLYKHTSQTDIVIGTPVANRHYFETRNLIGFFVNSLVLRTIVNPDETITELLQNVSNTVIDAQTNQDMPFDMLPEILKLQRDMSKHPVFQVMFGLQNFGTTFSKQLFKSSDISLDYTVAKCDLSWFMDDSNKQIKGNVTFATSLFFSDTIKRMTQQYLLVLEQLVKTPHKKIKDYQLLTEAEYKQVVYDWNSTDKDYPKNMTIHELFEDQAYKTPNNIAVGFEGKYLTYKELNQVTNQLANKIRSCYFMQTGKALVPDTLIALYLDRSIEIVIAKLAILKAGGAYVTLDTEYPEERINYILSDTDTKIILTQSNFKSYLNQLSNSINVLDITDCSLLEKESKILARIPVTSANLAYVVYTSGTTGIPKGVMVEHKNVISLVFNDYILTTKEDRFALLSATAFDASIFEIFTPLLSGAYLCIPTENKELFADIDKFEKFIIDNGITCLWLTKTLFDSLYTREPKVFASLKYLLIGGEALDLTLMNKLQISKSKPQYIINGYGPTENTTFSTSYNITKQIESLSVPIGTPIRNRKVYVLDTNCQPVPIGIIGELYVAGAGLSRGYLNNVKLTKEKYITNLFATDTDIINGYDRMYKTGDLVRWRLDGSLEYIGRNDFQVKIGGYRIELGEIETVLKSIKEIKQACVVVRNKDNLQYLAAYYVTDSSLNKDKLLDKLSMLLPEYMLPRSLMELDALPLTINGKLDNSSLPDPVFINANSYVPPQNEMELSLCSIYADVLRYEKVGINDDFFKLGGNSILSINLTNRINLEFDSKLKVSDIFTNRTPAQLLTQLNKGYRKYRPITRLNQSSSPHNLFMIHPGGEGCEVYYSLAQTLTGSYKCYGIDSYNLYNDTPFSTITELAEYYLMHINQIMLETQQNTFHLLGWCFGGNIAIEIANKLEQMGHKDIHVYLLDTVLSTSDLQKYRESLGEQREFYDELRQQFIEQDYCKNYIDRVINTIKLENKLINEIPTYKLYYSNIWLFKAMKLSRNEYSFWKHVITISDNNVQLYVKKSIHIICLDCHHDNILEAKEIDWISRQIETF